MMSTRGTSSCAQILQRDAECCGGSHVVTFSQAVDDLLHGGMPIGQVTEIAATPGLGKTQFCLQLCIDVQIPASFGGLAGHALLIDCESSFSPARCADIAAACVSHLDDISATSNADDACVSVDSLLSGVHVQAVTTHTQLLAILHQLPSWLLSCSPKIKIIAIDGIASLFRHLFTDYSLRSKLLNVVMQTALRIAHHHQLAVILTNQLTTRLGKSGGEASLVPALGDSWGHGACNRLVLEWLDGQRVLRIVKNDSSPSSLTPFQITESGIRDVATPSSTVNEKPSVSPTADPAGGK